MLKDKRVWIAVGVACVLVILGVVGLLLLGTPGQNGDPTGGATSGEKATYTVQVQNSNGMALEGVGIYIYEDSTQQELVTFAKTDAEGKMSFADVAKDGYVAVLDPVPTGYKVEEYYPLTGELTQIVLAAGSLEDVDVENIQYKLGDIMMDFAVTAVDGTEYKLSELLKTKKAVVLNFWYIECAPCKAEFPFLQEAYEEYKDSIEVLAMNPVNPSADDIAAFQKELGLTFPVIQADAAWEKMMQLTAYPTTVVIDRFGNINLIHTGTIPDAKTFKDTFAFFTAEDYVPTVVEDITTLLTEEEKGSKENPVEVGSVTSFEVTVGPGEVFYTDLYRVNDMYLQINSKDAYVLYNNKTYEPSGGKISILLSCPDNYTPAKVGIGNSGDKEQTFSVALIPKSGTFSNPYGMSLGEFSVSVSAGNEQGVYYAYTATEDGTITMQCLSATSGVDYDYSLYNLSNSVMRTMKSDADTNAETGAVTLSVQMKKGQRVMFSVGALPDSSNSYPAASFKFLATFTAGEVEDENAVEMATYKITVTDTENAPIPGVTLWITDKENNTVSYKTDETGVYSGEMIKGVYKVMLTVPEGYLLENNEFELTEEVLELTVQMQKQAAAVMADYTVTVVNKANQPIAGVKLGIGQQVVTTDAAGTAVFSLEEGGTYDASVFEVPKGYVSDQFAYSFATGSTEMTITLSYGPGTVQNPIDVEDVRAASVETETLATGEAVYYNIYYSDATVTVEDAQAQIVYNGQTYTADPTTGIVTVELPANADISQPAVIGVVGGSEEAKAYTLKLTYPEGSLGNPKAITRINNRTSVSLAAGDVNGCYYQWTPTERSKVFAWAHKATAGVPYDIILMSSNGVAKESEATAPEGETPKAELIVEKDEAIVIQVTALKDAQNVYQATDITLRTTSEAAPEEDDGDDEPIYPDELTYTVNVRDYTTGTAQALADDVYVYIKKDGSVVYSAVLGSANGTLSRVLPTATYTVELAFANTEATYKYAKSTAVLTPADPTLEIALANPLSDTTTSSYWFGSYYDAALGAAYVKTDASQANYAVYDGVGYCFFVLKVTQEGRYTFTTVDGAELVYFGSNVQAIYNQASTKTAENGEITINIKSSNLDGGGLQCILAVVVTDDVNDAVLQLRRTGEAVYDEHDAPWTAFEGEDTPEIVYNAENGTTSVKDPAKIFSLSNPGDLPLTYVDVTGATDDYKLVKGTDGYYHLNSESGPILYINLDSESYVSLYKMINGDGTAGGTAFRKIFYNADGTPEQDAGGNYHKEDYTDSMKAYTLHIDPTYGVYPLNDDLIYMMQNGGEYQGWYDPTSANYLFKDAEGNLTPDVNAEIAWMFAVCYLDQAQSTAFTLRAPTLEAKTEPVEEAAEQQEETQPVETTEQTEPVVTETSEPAVMEETEPAETETTEPVETEAAETVETEPTAE